MSEKVTYAEIIEALSRKTGLSKQKSEAFTKALIAEIKEELQETGKATITNFGSFEVKEVAERQGQNPQTGDPITIPAHKRVNFNPYKALREEVNAKYAHLKSELIGEKKEGPEAESKAVPQKSEADKQPEPDVKSEEIVEEKPKTFERREHARGNNTGMIMIAILVLVIIGLTSAWFLMGPDEQEETARNTSAQTEQETTVQAEPEPESPADDTEGISQNEMTSQEEAAPEEAEPTQSPEAAEQESSRTESGENIYQVGQDEWYWKIAEEVYGKAHFWPLIFEANFSRDTHPDSLETGTELKVPALSGSADDLTAQDYGRLASGAALVSSAYENFGRMDKAQEYATFAEKWDQMSKN